MAELAEEFHRLIERVRLGDELALAELAQQYEPEVRLTARILLGRALRCHLDSTDLVQSVHHTLILGVRQNRFVFASPQHLMGLAVTLVRRKVARHWRRLKRQQRPEDLGFLDTEAGLLATLPSHEPDPAQSVQDADLLAQVCDGLDDRDKQLIELRLQGCSTADAARRLGLDPDVLRVRLSRLRKRLREREVLSAWL